MFDKLLVEQTRRAEERYKKDHARREERKLHLEQPQRKEIDADRSRIDESQRIGARADMLGIRTACDDMAEPPSYGCWNV